MSHWNSSHQSCLLRGMKSKIDCDSFALKECYKLFQLCACACLSFFQFCNSKVGDKGTEKIDRMHRLTDLEVGWCHCGSWFAYRLKGDQMQNRLVLQLLLKQNKASNFTALPFELNAIHKKVTLCVKKKWLGWGERKLRWQPDKWCNMGCHCH